MTKAFRAEDFKGRPTAGPKLKSVRCDLYDVPLCGPPAGFVTQDSRSNCQFLAVVFIDGLAISLGRYCTRREAALAIAEVHNGGNNIPPPAMPTYPRTGGDV
jgi:hypothetical protein